MNIRNHLTGQQTKRKSMEVVDYIVSKPSAIEELMECFFDDELRVCQYAAWPVGILGEKHPEIILPYLHKMVSNLENPKHDAVVRNTIRTLQYIDVPEELEGEVYERCFNYLVSPGFPVAVKVFSMSVLARIAMKIPELKEELIIAIEDYKPLGTAGYQSRAKKVIKMLQS
jgi:hypothetical protein